MFGSVLSVFLWFSRRGCDGKFEIRNPKSEIAQGWLRWICVSLRDLRLLRLRWL